MSLRRLASLLFPAALGCDHVSDGPRSPERSPDPSCPAVAAIEAAPAPAPMPPPNMPLLQFAEADRTATDGLLGRVAPDRCGWVRRDGWAIRYRGDQPTEFLAKFPAAKDCAGALTVIQQWGGYLEQVQAPRFEARRCVWGRGAMRWSRTDAAAQFELDTGLVHVQREAAAR